MGCFGTGVWLTWWEACQFVGRLPWWKWVTLDYHPRSATVLLSVLRWDPSFSHTDPSTSPCTEHGPSQFCFSHGALTNGIFCCMFLAGQTEPRLILYMCLLQDWWAFSYSLKRVICPSLCALIVAYLLECLLPGMVCVSVTGRCEYLSKVTYSLCSPDAYYGTWQAELNRC